MFKSLKALIIKILDFLRYKKSYAQDGEDVVLAAFFDGFKHYKGFFVDVGAHHPVRFSNTWLFYKRGWKGINIDPTPGCMRTFKLLRGRDINLEIGVGPEQGVLTFYCFNEPALNTFSKEVAEERNTGNPYKVVKTIDVPVMPLSEVLKQFLPAGQKIDFLSIDVEGLDLAVLKSNDWNLYRPSFLLVEDTKFNINRIQDSELNQYLSALGYQIVALLQRTIVYKQVDS